MLKGGFGLAILFLFGSHSGIMQEDWRFHHCLVIEQVCLSQDQEKNLSRCSDKPEINYSNLNRKKYASQSNRNPELRVSHPLHTYIYQQILSPISSDLLFESSGSSNRDL